MCEKLYLFSSFFTFVMQCIPHILFFIDFSVVLVVNGIYVDIDFFNQISGFILDKME